MGGMRSQSAATPDAAFYAVIPVKFQTTVVYAVAGMLTGLSGMIRGIAADDGPVDRRTRLRAYGDRGGSDRRRDHIGGCVR